MSRYQLLDDQSAYNEGTHEDEGAGAPDRLTTALNVTARTAIWNHAWPIRANSYDSSSSSNNTSTFHNNNYTPICNNNNRSSSSSLNSRSSNSNAREYRPFASYTNNISQTTTPTTTAESTETAAKSSVSTPMSSMLFLGASDADDTTMEVPLLGNNNNDYHSHGGQQFSATSAATATANICHLPGFNANLRTTSTQDAKFRILLAITLCCVFMIVEFLGGYLAGSLAIMTDAAHLASDCISFVIGLVAIWLGGRPPDNRMSFGYKRMEVMGAILSILGIWILTATLIMMAIERLYSNDFDLDANTMMIISGIGILINIVMVFILHGSSLLRGTGHGHSHAHAHAHARAHSHNSHAAAGSALLQMNSPNGNGNHLKPTQNCDASENLNLRAAMIHVIGDLVQSVGVFLASVLIQIYPSAKFADPLCTVLFSVIVVMTTVRLFRESVGILLDAVPPAITLDSLEMDLTNIDGVKSLHHLNVWSHTTNYNILMAHLVIDFSSDSNTVLQSATQMACGPKYNIKHCTIQIERLTS